MEVGSDNLFLTIPAGSPAENFASVNQRVKKVPLDPAAEVVSPNENKKKNITEKLCSTLM